MFETIEEKIAKIFHKAYTNNQLYEYLTGIGEYKVVFKDSANYDYNDMELMQKGINTYLLKNQNINLDEFLNETLMKYLKSNDIFKVNAVLDFVVYYVKYIKKDNVRFKINLDKIIPILKEKLLLLKQMMLETSNHYNNGSNFWQGIENQCDLYEIRTGKKIL